MTNKAVLDKLTRARAGLILDQPFFGSLALRLLLVEMPDGMRQDFVTRGMTPTLAVDGRRVFYAPEYVDRLSLALVKSALAHEVGHCVFDHTSRRGARNRDNWNIAGDYVINQMIKDSGFEIGEGWLLNDAYKGMTADHIYSMLPPPNPNGGGTGTGNGKPLCDIMDGDSPDSPPLTPDEQRDWKIATIQAANAAKMDGKLPGPLEQFIDNLVNPKVDWRSMLRRFLTDRSNNDYSWMRPNRRMLSQGFYLPSLYSEKMGAIALFKDISASIDDEVQDAFNAEMRAIMQDVQPEEIHSLYIDTGVQRADRFSDANEVKFENVHGGGTDFRPPFNYLNENDIHPRCAIYLTDLEGPFPEQEPDYPVLWVTINDHVAPWGETIKIDL